MKKYLAVALLALQLQAGSVLLQRAEHTSFDPDVTNVFTQHYDVQTQRAEVISSVKGKNSFNYKRTAQYDKDGNRTIFWEEFIWNEHDKKWVKDSKWHFDVANNKKTYAIYQASEGKWVEQSRYEEINDGRATTQIAYEFKQNRLLPTKKSYVLLGENNQTALSEEYAYDPQNSCWNPESKTEYFYDKKGQIYKKLSYKGRDGKWIAHIKITYDDRPSGESVFTKWAWENEKWQEKEQDITAWDEAKRQKTSLNTAWNAQKNTRQNLNRTLSSYTKDNRPSLHTFFKWDESAKRWRKLSETSYAYDDKGRVSKQENFYFEQNQESRQTSYIYDENGNTRQELIKQYDFAAKSWRDVQKIVYSYDTSVKKQDVIDKENIGDDALVPATNALVQKEIYIIKDEKFTLKERARFFYKNLR